MLLSCVLQPIVIIDYFGRASRVARPSQGGENMIAMWTSRHDDLASDDVVALHVFDPMVVPACGVVLTRCNSLGSAVDAGLDAAARVLGAERAAGGLCC